MEKKCAKDCAVGYSDGWMDVGIGMEKENVRVANKSKRWREKIVLESPHLLSKSVSARRPLDIVSVDLTFFNSRSAAVSLSVLRLSKHTHAERKRKTHSKI